MFVERRPSRARDRRDTLNARGLLTDLGRPWTRGTVHQVLTNEKYIGNNVYNRVSFKLKKRRVVNPRDMWVRADGAHILRSLIDALFDRARAIMTRAPASIPDEELLSFLRILLEQQGIALGPDHRRAR